MVAGHDGLPRKEREMGTGSPVFRRFGAGDVGVIRRWTGLFAPYSDVHALGLLCWNTGEDGELAIVNSNLAFTLRRYDGNGFFLKFLGTHEVVKTVRQLLRYARTQLDVEPAGVGGIVRVRICRVEMEIEGRRFSAEVHFNRDMPTTMTLLSRQDVFRQFLFGFDERDVQFLTHPYL
jgi:hypothetical protein